MHEGSSGLCSGNSTRGRLGDSRAQNVAPAWPFVTREAKPGQSAGSPLPAEAKERVPEAVAENVRTRGSNTEIIVNNAPTLTPSPTATHSTHSQPLVASHAELTTKPNLNFSENRTYPLTLPTVLVCTRRCVHSITTGWDGEQDQRRTHL